MTTEALKGFFALLETDEEDFATLIKRYGIDPAKDLQNCDLTNVDFGRLVADTLDVTGAVLDGANLTQVRCRHVVGYSGTTPPTRPKNLLDDLRVAIQRYQNSDWTLNQVLSRLGDSNAPVLAFYNTAAEQDVLTKRLCTHFTAEVLGDGPSPGWGSLLWFYSKAYSTERFRLNPATLDNNFFDLIRTDKIAHDIGVYPFVSNQAALERICRSVAPGPYDQMRSQFAKSIARELSKTRRVETVFSQRAIVIFSGFPPISKRLYQEITKASNARLQMVFLCSSSLEPFYEEANGMPWRRIAVPPYSIGEPLAVHDDVRRLKKRVGVATQGRVSISEEANVWMEEHVGKPLAGLKAELLRRLKVRIGSAVELEPVTL